MKLKKQKGAALMNLLIGLGVIVIIATISIPLLNSYKPRLNLSSAAKIIATDLRYAQQLTIAKQKIHLVEFNQIGNSYQIKKIGSATTTIKEAFLPEQIYFSQITGLTDNKVFFNFYGGVVETGLIVLINAVNSTSTIEIKPSGYVQVN